MRLLVLLGAAAALSMSVAGTASAVEFGTPDFPNYLSRTGLVTCDSSYDSYVRACPTPDLPPKAVPAPEAKGKSKAVKGK